MSGAATVARADVGCRHLGNVGETCDRHDGDMRHRVTIGRADLDEPSLGAFLRDHLAAMEPTAPSESRHALDLGGLRSPGVRVWVTQRGEDILGTAALAELEPGHEELKSMRTEPRSRGRGIARRLLDHLVADARARGVVRISLETGSMEFFAPARALYRTSGFEECPPFGSYVEDPNSVFMTRSLSSAPRP